MTGMTTLRSLNSVMVVTLHVAAISYVVRTFARPSSLSGSLLIWVPISILLALFLSVPIGRAVAAAFAPPEGDRACRRCGRRDLRPLLRAGDGLFQPVVGYRCASCRTTYRPIGDALAEEPAPDPADVAGPGEVRFLPGPAERGGDDPGIRFLDEPGR